MKKAPLSVDELHERLEELCSMVLTVRRSVRGAAEDLAAFDRPAQERFLAAVELVTSTSDELAYNFCMFGRGALRLLDAAKWDDWVQHILATYDRGGVLKSIVAMQRAPDYVAAARATRAGVALEELAGALEHFLLGLAGRPLKIAPAETAWTDTETVYLPAAVERFGERERNLHLLKATAVHLWAQAWFGTWRGRLAETLQGFPDPDRARHRFLLLETMRLDARLAEALPGMHRVMMGLREGDGGPPPGPWARAAAGVERPGAGVAESCDWLPHVYEESQCPALPCYAGRLYPERTEAVIAQRRARDREALQEVLACIARDVDTGGRRPDEDGGAAPARFSVTRAEDLERPEGFRFELLVEGKPVAPLEDVRRTLDSIAQDFGHIPSEYLVPAGHGRYGPGTAGPSGERPGRDLEDKGHRYDEWDHARRRYRKDWCLLYEKDVHPQWDDFVERTRRKYRGLLKELSRTFEALRGEDRKLKRQPYGDDIDLDAVIESYVDRRLGREEAQRQFQKRRRVERDVAVMFLVDMSGSTKGWINDVEREALVLLCESLETLGDRYAIYGFSGYSHRRCEVFRVKRMEEEYTEEVRARISGIWPQDYTRMGAAIRHTAGLLDAVEARTRLLVTISDGRPDDQDGYRGPYGVEDTRQALLEAKHRGIHPYCVTIDLEAHEYLPRMYGAVNYTVIDEPRKLPCKISDVYRKLAT